MYISYQKKKSEIKLHSCSNNDKSKVRLVRVLFGLHTEDAPSKSRKHRDSHFLLADPQSYALESQDNLLQGPDHSLQGDVSKGSMTVLPALTLACFLPWASLPTMLKPGSWRLGSVLMQSGSSLCVPARGQHPGPGPSGTRPRIQRAAQLPYLMAVYWSLLCARPQEITVQSAVLAVDGLRVENRP